MEHTGEVERTTATGTQQGALVSPSRQQEGSEGCIQIGELVYFMNECTMSIVEFVVEWGIPPPRNSSRMACLCFLSPGPLIPIVSVSSVDAQHVSSSSLLASSATEANVGAALWLPKPPITQSSCRPGAGAAGASAVTFLHQKLGN